ncbi:MAG: hypothetical protein OER56_05665, partial [Hyphomicrobiales bacterium]|nr:hypothetical protein [Hyphomicrobiales bacterium]
RLVSAALSAGWALLAVWQIFEQVIHGHRTEPAELAILIAGIALMSALGYHIATSPRIRLFLGPIDRP